MYRMERSAGSNFIRALRAVVLLAVAPLLLGAICGGGEDSNIPELEPFTVDREQQLHDIRDLAAEVRGLEINLDTNEGTLSREANRAYFEEEFSNLDEDDIEELEALDLALRLLHLLGPEDEVIEVVTTFYADGVAGFYMRQGDQLVLIAETGDVIWPEDEMTLAHEYVHSFQHGTYGLDRLDDYIENDDGDSRTEYGTTIDCLIEGDATLSMVLYMEEVYGEDWRLALGSDETEEAEDNPVEPESDTPPAFDRYFSFNYRECYWFMSALYEQGGWEAVDAAYANPPSTTEQILHLEKYQKAEAPRSPAPASIEASIGEGWSLFDLSPFGEFDVYNYVATVLEDEQLAYQAAAGWGSGWTSVYVQEQDDLEGDPSVLVHLRLDWDTTIDFVEFMSVFGEVINVVSDGDWEMDMVASTLQWENANEFGYVTWNETLNRVDIVISSERQPRDDVTSAQILRP